MNLSTTAQATLLLTCHFSKASKEQVKPLTTTEWGRFAVWLKEKGMTPADLLTGDAYTALASWCDSHVSVERLQALLARGHSLALAMEKWQRAGLWVVTRSDADYPKRLKARLRTDSPPVLFGCGNKSLLEIGGVAVVGSRNVGDADLAFTVALGAKAAVQGIGIVSGGARGIDETAMSGAIRAGGQVIGVMADSLLSAATSAKWRKGIMDGNLVLLSPFYPEAGFSAGNAMARNKYIYCLADSGIVVHSGKTGGTFNGAEENLKKQWIPLWVKPSQDSDAGNPLLVAQGGRWLESDIKQLTLHSLVNIPVVNDLSPIVVQTTLFPPERQTDLFSNQVGKADNVEIEATMQNSESSQIDDNPTINIDITSNNNAIDFYQLFVKETARLAITPISLDELVKKTSLHKSQINEWLKNMLEEGLIKKFDRPKRYQYNEFKSS